MAEAANKARDKASAAILEAPKNVQILKAGKEAEERIEKKRAEVLEWQRKQMVKLLRGYLKSEGGAS